ncbi:MAG: DUF4212 domain-containing protein [Chloroflexaceae bacterium]
MATADRKIAKVDSEEKAQAYWKTNIRLILGLLAVWALVSYVAAIGLALPLADVRIGNVPFSFWMAHQGAIVIFVILIFTYAKIMDRVDNKFDVHE